MNQEVSTTGPRGMKIRRAALVILCAVGLILCGLLLQAGDSENSGILNKFCAPSAKVNCASALASAWSKIGGISAALLGSVYFGAMLVWFVGVGIPNRAGSRWHLFPVLLSTIGLFYSAYFIWVMATQLNVWCTLCIGVHVVNALIWLMAISSWPKDSGDIAYPSFGRAGAVLGATGAAVVILALGIWSIQLQIAARRFQSEFLQVVNDPAYIEWKLSQQPVQEIAVGPDDLVLGKNDTRNIVVVFSDFECPKCRQFDQFAQRMVNLGMDVRIVFKNFPMSSQCNPYVKDSFHTKACDAARYAQAGVASFKNRSSALGLRQIIFDEIDRLFRGKPAIKLAFDGGDSWNQVMSHAESEAVSIKIKNDIELGHRLGVEGTPAIFINGRRLKTNWQIVTNDVHPTLDLKATDALWRRLLGAPSPQK